MFDVVKIMPPGSGTYKCPHFAQCFPHWHTSRRQKLLRNVVGPPAGMDWASPWHEILHDWNGRVNEFAALHRIKLWSERCIQQHWDLAHYISSLEDQRWVKRLLQWQPNGRRRGGRPAHLWHTVLEIFCRWKGLQHWTLESRNQQSWMAMFPDFLHFVNL